MLAIRFAAFAALLALATPAQAETKTFLIDSSDGYGIDRCLAAGEACGRAAATALCRANAFAQVVDYRPHGTERNHRHIAGRAAAQSLPGAVLPGESRHHLHALKRRLSRLCWLPSGGLVVAACVLREPFAPCG